VVKDSGMKHEDITKDIIGAAMAVLNELKPGLDEKLYENALVIELVARGHKVEQQREFPVHYKGHFIGKLIPDLIVDGKVIVDPKVAAAFNDTHIAQMLGYLNITGLEVALLLNFKEATLTWKRVVRGNKESDHGLRG
jgi:GxxExxY protein